MALRIFFLFRIFIFIYFFKYETIETHARAFLTLKILAIDRVLGIKKIGAIPILSQQKDWVGGWLGLENGHF